MLPDFVSERLTSWLGVRIRGVVPLAGGMIAQAMRVDTETGTLFVKWSADAPDRLFADESYGLSLIKQSRTIRVPTLLAVCDRTPDLPQEPIPFTFLAMEYIEPTRPADPAAFTRRFAEKLAALHQARLRSDRGFGLENDNFIGLTPQTNLPRTHSWPEFYRDCRLLPQIAHARENGLLPPARERLLLQVSEKTPDLLADIPPEISLIHGDLWSGNFLCAAGDEPVLIDPSAYYGHREMEIAYIDLFGGFPADFVACYNDAWPLDAGYLRRRPLHQLYHLINHLNHFGEQYGQSVESACRAVLAAR